MKTGRVVSKLIKSRKRGMDGRVKKRNAEGDKDRCRGELVIALTSIM